MAIKFYAVQLLALTAVREHTARTIIIPWPLTCYSIALVYNGSASHRSFTPLKKSCVFVRTTLIEHTFILGTNKINFIYAYNCYLYSSLYTIYMRIYVSTPSYVYTVGTLLCSQYDIH